MKIKSQKGSITIFVLIALLFYTAFLLLMYAANTNKFKTITEKSEILKGIYEKNIDDVNEIYKGKISQMKPKIKDLPSSITVGTTRLEEDYAEYDSLGGETTYLAFEQTFSNFNELIQYVLNNNLYGNCKIKVEATGNNGMTTEKTVQIEILEQTQEENSENENNESL